MALLLGVVELCPSCPLAVGVTKLNNKLPALKALNYCLYSFLHIYRYSKKIYIYSSAPSLPSHAALLLPLRPHSVAAPAVVVAGLRQPAVAPEWWARRPGPGPIREGR